MDYKQQAHAFGQWITTNGKGPYKQINGQVRGRCPKQSHEDKHPSFSYDMDKDAYACSCASGKGSELRRELGYTNGHDITPHIKNFRKPEPEMEPPDDKGPDDIYEYENNNRKLKWRFPDGKKTCKWEHKVGESWMTGKEGDCGLYRQSCIDLMDTIILSESESDVDSLISLGFAAVSVANGASSPLQKVQARLFEGKVVLIAEHNDEPGRKFSAACHDTLAIYAEPYILRGFDGHKDIREWILAGATTEQVQEAMKAALPKTPQPIDGEQLEAMDLGQVEWTIRPLGAKGMVTLVQGNPKGGKSAFCLYVALCIAKGRWLAGKFDIDKSRKVMYFAYEDNLRRTRERLMEFTRGLKSGGIPKDFMTYQMPPKIRLAERSTLFFLKRLIREYSLEVLVIDTFRYAHGLDENKSFEMQPVMENLRNLVETTGINIWLVHHVRKGGTAGDLAPTSVRGSGSTAIPAGADMILDWGKREVGSHQTPCHLDSKEKGDPNFVANYLESVEDDLDVVTWAMEDAIERDSTVEKEQKILDALNSLWGSSGPKVTTRQVSDLTTIPQMTCRDYLTSMAKRDIISRSEGKNRTAFWSNSSLRNESS